ncbi:unnamed protein product [Ixodes pacificus]
MCHTYKYHKMARVSVFWQSTKHNSGLNTTIGCDITMSHPITCPDGFCRRERKVTNILLPRPNHFNSRMNGAGIPLSRAKSYKDSGEKSCLLSQLFAVQKSTRHR